MASPDESLDNVEMVRAHNPEDAVQPGVDINARDLTEPRHDLVMSPLTGFHQRSPGASVKPSWSQIQRWLMSALVKTQIKIQDTKCPKAPIIGSSVHEPIMSIWAFCAFYILCFYGKDLTAMFNQ